MILCFDCPRELKAALDRLLRTGRYADRAEAIACAVENLELLHHRIARDGPVLWEDDRVMEPSGDNPLPFRLPPASAGRRSFRGLSRRELGEIPAIFRLGGFSETPPPRLAVCNAEGASASLSVGDWIFGQENKLLPLKLSCRALARLLAQNPSGVRLVPAAQVIWADARVLGEKLRELEARAGSAAELSAGLPLDSTESASSGRRFVEHFVGKIDRSGRLRGLPSDLKLLGKLDGDGRCVALTEAGWRFAVAENPVLDGGQETLLSPLCGEEAEMLLRHILRSVPVEAAAISAILEAIHSGHDAPVSLAAALRPSTAGDGALADRIFTTQRAGALSRMSDLGLISRMRTGRLVRYGLTDTGRLWRRRFSEARRDRLVPSIA